MEEKLSTHSSDQTVEDAGIVGNSSSDQDGSNNSDQIAEDAPLAGSNLDQIKEDAGISHNKLDYNVQEAGRAELDQGPLEIKESPNVESVVEDCTNKPSGAVIFVMSNQDRVQNSGDVPDQVASTTHKDIPAGTPDVESHIEDGLTEQRQASVISFSNQDQIENNTGKNLCEDLPDEMIHQVDHKMPEDIPERTQDVVDSVKEHSTPEESPSKTDSAVPVPKTTINVYIKWTDSETGQTTLLVWDHQSCEVCCSTLSNWQKHVKEEHKLHGSTMQKSTSKSQKERQIPKLRIPRKADTESLKSVGEKDHKMDSAESQENMESIAVQFPVPDTPVIKSEAEEVVPTKKRGRPRKNARQEGVVVVPKKRGRPRKDSSHDNMVVVNKNRGRPKTSVKQGSPPTKLEHDESDHHTDTEPKSDPPKVKSEDENDPDYIPSQKQESLRPKRASKSHPSKMYNCAREDCGVSFKKLKDLKDHQRNVHGDENFKCTHEGCGKMFQSRWKRDQHIGTHAAQSKQPIEYKCNLCNLTFLSAKERGKHLRTHFPVEEGAEKDFECPFCNQTFERPSHFNWHVKNVHQEKSIGCDQCRRLFKTQEALDHHKRVHTGTGVLLVCQFCGKKLNTRGSLERHERVHKGEKPYKCEHCDKSFVCHRSWQNHVQDHTGAQYVCSQCGFKTKYKHYLAQHELTHTGATPYECKMCGAKYGSQSGLRTHKQAKHSESMQFKCDICTKMFWSSDSLRSHRALHSGQRNYECEYCHKRFKCRNARNGHIKQVHLGMKRRGHQGRAKRQKEEALLAQQEDEQLKATLNAKLNPGGKTGYKPSTSTDDTATSSEAAEVARNQEGQAMNMLPGRHQAMYMLPDPLIMPLRLGAESGSLVGLQALHHLQQGQISPPHNSTSSW